MKCPRVRGREPTAGEVLVDAGLVEELKRHLSAEALVQLTLTVAMANFTNRVNEALGTELES